MDGAGRREGVMLAELVSSAWLGRVVLGGGPHGKLTLWRQADLAFRGTPAAYHREQEGETRQGWAAPIRGFSGQANSLGGGPAAFQQIMGRSTSRAAQ